MEEQANSVLHTADPVGGPVSLPPSDPSARVAAKALRAVEHVRRMRGGSQAHLLRCSDSNHYVVKFQGNPQGARILVNELLGTLLAAQLGLPVSPSAIVHVSEELIRLTPDISFETPNARVPCQPGQQFGSRYPLDPRSGAALDLLADSELVNLKNPQDFLGMLVFDKWTCNVDGRQTVFYKEQNDSRFRAVMIDQGFCFNAEKWSFPDAPRRGLYYRRAVYEQLRGMDDFEPWLSRLETEIDAGVISDVANGVPAEWSGLDRAALLRLAEQLDLRRSRVRELLWSALHASPEVFPNWTGAAVRCFVQAPGNSVSRNNGRKEDVHGREIHQEKEGFSETFLKRGK